MKDLTIFALSGSLRAASLNTSALQMLQKIAPSNITISIGSLSDVPLFNPDRDDDYIESVDALKTSLKACDGLIIASPEYAHGVTGVLKNALDWLVSSDEFVDKPIMLINTSARATHAQASLKEILKTMSGKLIDEAHVTIALLGHHSQSNNVASDDFSHSLLKGLTKFCDAIEARVDVNE